MKEEGLRPGYLVAMSGNERYDENKGHSADWTRLNWYRSIVVDWTEMESDEGDVGERRRRVGRGTHKGFNARG